MHNSAALAQYQDVAVDCRVAGSSPHSLVSMLFDGILKNLAIANGAIDRGDVAEKGSKISAAIRIIDSLRASLDLEKGGDLAENLRALYDYMERRLAEANMENDKTILREVTSLVDSLKSGWDAMPPEYKG